MGKSLRQSRGPKKLEKVATYQGFMHILSVFKHRKNTKHKKYKKTLQIIIK